MEQKKEKGLRIRSCLTGAIWLALVFSTVISALLFAFLNHFFNLPGSIPVLGWLLIFNTLIAGLITSFINAKLLEPITRLGKAMKEVSQGDFEQHLETNSRIAEVGESYQSFNVMTKELRATEVLQMDFVSNVSHEFKTPINAIEGYTMLLQGEELSPDQEEYVEKILFNTQRLSGLVGNILLLSKLENQNIPMKKTEYRLDEQIRQAFLSLETKWTEKEIEIPMFRPVKVFDVSQTDGKPLPELASSLSGNVPNYEAFMEALRRSAPVPITFEAMAADTDGYFSADHQKIAIRKGMSEVQTVSATVHEIAHSKLHNQKKIQIANDEQYQEIELFDKPGLFSNGRIVRDNLPEDVYCYDLRGSDYDPGEPVCVEEQVVVNHAGSVLLTEPLELAEDGRLILTEEEGLNFVGGFSTLTQFLQEQRKDRHTEEVEAESISYAVCKYFGIETGENSFGYIASWSQGKELKELHYAHNKQQAAEQLGKPVAVDQRGKIGAEPGAGHA